MNTENTTQDTDSHDKAKKEGLTITLPLTLALWFAPLILLFVGTFCIMEIMKYYN